MLKWIINKSTRAVSPWPYSGPTCISAGVPQGKIYENWKEAVADAMKLSECNMVGFVVVPYPEKEEDYPVLVQF